ncbi:MAG: glycoside hydrolase family 15 protein [Proteobacteria bacterium]|nr:glycoside hydrolase family 15 protein [Pseudomonadota bacterium]
MRRLSALLNFSLLLTALTFPCSSFGVGIFHDLALEDWISYQEPLAFKNLVRNISAPGTAKGSVLASPSKNSPDYFFHWVRDAAVVMDEMVTRYETAIILKNKNRYLESLIDYIYFSKLNQQTPNLSGGLGEPKFNVDGTAFSESWGRPQDDGPAMRAATLIHLAKVWLKEGNEKLVAEKLYDGTANSIIKKDLEYVSHQWKNVSFELWEEVKGHHFHTRMVQYRAMIEGAELANLLSDFKAADWYLSQASEMEPELERHWSFTKRILVSTLDREDGLDYKYSELDSSVILGINQGHVENGFMSFSDDRVLATVNALEEAFYRLYSVNRNGAPGIAMGRYPEDRYDGFSSGASGNPWFLITSGFAEFYYRLARDLNHKHEIKISAVNKGFYRSLGIKRKSYDSYKKGSSEYIQLIEAIHAKGDSFLSRVKYHVDGTGSISEQINRDSGYMQGARDLTWSYAALLSAIRFR